MERNFMEMIRARWKKGKFLCVGLDSDEEKLPPVEWRSGQMAREHQLIFNKAIADATHDFVCAYKLNFAFYASEGLDGLWVLEQTIEYILEQYPSIPIILDGKWGEIGNTNAHYAKMAFDWLKADAVTVNPYLGREGALEPFFERRDKGVFVLCKTSNEGADEVQDFVFPLYKLVALWARVWNTNGNCGLVVGATYPDELKKVRLIAPDLPILIPGVGAQGGDLKSAVLAAADRNGEGFIINVSRSIIFAKRDIDFAKAARKEAKKIHRAIRNVLKKEEQSDEPAKRRRP